MRKLIVLATGLTLVAAAVKADPPFAYGMTGQMLVRKFDGDKYTDRELAAMYLSGVKDTTQGMVWCLRGIVKPDELDSELVAALKKLPAEKLRGNAAPLVVDILSIKFPCSATRTKP